MASLRDVALLRLAAQRIAAPGAGGVEDTVRWMTALQAQDYKAALAAVTLRTAGATTSDVEAALDAGEVVRSWPMRGTLHFVAASDALWMLELLTPRVVSAAASRRSALALDESTFERARQVADDALRGGRRLVRRELYAAWRGAGLSLEGQRGYHLLWHLAQEGMLCFGPVHAGEQAVVLVEEWIRHPRRLEPDEALAELAGRYFRSHGPATVADFTRWARLPVRTARRALALAGHGLERLEADGDEHFMDPATPETLRACRRRAQGVFLLPAYDEYLLGYGDRRAAVPRDVAAHMAPAANGLFRPTIVVDGRVIGLWAEQGRGERRALEIRPFAPLRPRVAEAVARAHAALPP